VFGGAAVDPGPRGEVVAALRGAPAGAELVPRCEAGAADPGTPAESGGGSVPGAGTEPATVVAVVAVVDGDRRSTDVDVGRLA
jgi:hypothetical protein